MRLGVCDTAWRVPGLLERWELGDARRVAGDDAVDAADWNV